MRRHAGWAWLLPGAILGVGCPSSYSNRPGGDADAGDAQADDDGSIVIDFDGGAKDGTAAFDTNVQAGTPCDVEKPFGTPTRLTEFDTSDDDFSLRLSSNYLTAYFSSVRASDAGENALWMATRPSTESLFAGFAPLSTLNGTIGVSGPSVTGDGLTIYYTHAADGDGDSDDIYTATRTTLTAAFSHPVVVANVNSTSVDHAPFIREDGRVLYFSSTVSGAYEIYSATKGKTTFAVPVSITELNMVGNNDAPIISPDGLVIYYGSDRTDDGALGDYDVWVSTRASTTMPFGATKDVLELNTAAGERPDFVTRDLCTLYLHRDFTSDAGTVTRVEFVATKTP